MLTARRFTNRLSSRCVAAALVASVGLAASAHGQVRIAEIYGGGGSATATYQEDYVVLFNAGPVAQNLAGWSVQYASATGSFSTALTASPTGTIQPGGYFLVKMSSGTGISNIPTPDYSHPTNIAMSATAGKVALCNSTTILSGTCPSDSSIQDFVGYGTTANCREGTVTADNAPAPSTLNATARFLGGCFETNNNNRDFAAGTPNPRNISSGTQTCSPATDLGVTATVGACPSTVGAPVNVGVVVVNNGVFASNATVSISIPAGLTFNSSTPSGTFAAGTLTVSVPGLGAGASQIIDVSVTPTTPNAYGVGASVASSITEPFTENDAARTNVLGGATTALHTARFSNLTGSPNALVPTGYSVAGAEFVPGTGTGIEVFGRPYLSPGGSKFVVRARANQATGIDEFLMVAPVDGSSAPTFIVQEGATQITPGETLGVIDIIPSVNDNGDVAFSGDTNAATTADEVVAKKVGSAISVVAREGDTIDSIVIGATQTSFGISNAGNVLFTFVGNPVTTADNRLVEQDGMGGFTVHAAEGFTAPNNQANGGFAGWSTFDAVIGASPRVTSTGDVFIPGNLVGTLECVAVNNETIVMDGSTVAGGTVSTIAGTESRGDHHIAFGSNSDGNDWLLVDGVLTAARGTPITTGSTELWTDAPLGTAFAATFFIGVVNENGDYVIGGTTTGHAEPANAVMVLNGTTVLARENDPVDLNGDGVFNDDAYIRVFRNDRAFLTNTTLCFVAEIRTAAASCSGNTKFADALICIPIGAPACPGDFNDSGSVTADDIFAFLDAWFAQNGQSGPGLTADVNNSGSVTADDIFAFLDTWFANNGNTCP